MQTGLFPTYSTSKDKGFGIPSLQLTLGDPEKNTEINQSKLGK